MKSEVETMVEVGIAEGIRPAEEVVMIMEGVETMVEEVEDAEVVDVEAEEVIETQNYAIEIY